MFPMTHTHVQALIAEHKRKTERKRLEDQPFYIKRVFPQESTVSTGMPLVVYSKKRETDK